MIFPPQFRLPMWLSTILVVGVAHSACYGISPELREWLDTEQRWKHDLNGPVISLGKDNDFDSNSVLATSVSIANTREPKFWYTGGRGEGKDRVWRLGWASTGDSVTCQKQGRIFEFPEGRTSILNLSALRNRDGWAWRYGRTGDILYFTATRFDQSPQTYAIHEIQSRDGKSWSAPSPPLLQNACSPQVMRDGNDFRMWYNDTSQEPWVIRHAACDTDTAKWTVGDWKVTPAAVLKTDQRWEAGSLLNPVVLKVNDIYQMWYVARIKGGRGETALGFAVSADGLTWIKHPRNPIFRPGKNQVISTPTVKRMPGGAFRIWYASRPVSASEYQCSAIKTIRWQPKAPLPISAVTSCPDDPQRFEKWRDEKRAAIIKMLGIPKERIPLDPEKRGEYEQDEVVIERWVFTTETGSRAPALLYRPKHARGKMPAIVMNFGHGDSKSAWYCQYAGQVYAKLGIACLAVDPIGSEERHPAGVRAIGARGHDKPYSLIERSEAVNRRIMGKLVFDFIRGIDFLMQRNDIDHSRIGAAGNSLGGAEATWLSIVEPRIKIAVVSGWGYTENLLYSGKDCTRLPNMWLRERMSWLDAMLLSAPNCKVLFVNGADDFHYVLSWDYLDRLAAESSRILSQLGMSSNTFTWTEPDATHRPFHIHKQALRWIHQHLGTPNMTLEEIDKLPVAIGGAWCKANGFRIEGFYASVKSQTGCQLPDLGLRRIPQKELLCLKPEELGRPEFTIEGWLRELE